MGRRFHGINPSKNKQDKRFKKIAEEREKKKRLMGAGDDSDNPTARMHAVQEQTATPYLVRIPLFSLSTLSLTHYPKFQL